LNLQSLIMFLGIDLGTGSVKALLLDAEGRVVSEARSSYPVLSPHSGWAETDPVAWWNATVQAVRQAVGSKANDVQAISFSGQMHGLVACDEKGTPLRNAILWADTRSTKELSHYHALSRSLKQKLANPFATGMAGVTLLWLREHEQNIYNSACWVLQPKDWLRFKLTGTFNAEPSDASATLLYDLTTDTWAHDILATLELRSDWLPQLVPSTQVVGTLTSQASLELGLPTTTQVAAGAGDAAASALGSALIAEGDVQVNIGTAMQIFAIRDKAKVDPTLRTHLYRSSLDNYYAMAAMQNAGIALGWVRKILGMSWDEMYAEAFDIPAGCEGVTFLPYLTGERTPHLDPNVRGLWHGMGLGHERGHLARAAFEGVAFALNDGLKALEDTVIRADSLRLAGGGTLQSEWRQLLADVLEKPLDVVSVPSSSARGAALLAGLSIKAFSVQDILSFTPKPERTAEPVQNERLETAYQRFRGLYQTVKTLNSV
jgi:xylulokinase